MWCEKSRKKERERRTLLSLFPSNFDTVQTWCGVRVFLPLFCASLLCEWFGGWKELFPLSSAVCVDFIKS